MEFQLLVNMQVASATKPFLIIRSPQNVGKMLYGYFGMQ